MWPISGRSSRIRHQNQLTVKVWDITSLPHSVALEFYVKSFQYKLLNNILYTNKKLFKIDYRTDDVCTFL